MLDAKTILLVLLGLIAAAFIAFWVRELLAARTAGGSAQLRPTPYQFVVGFITDFLDALGIGSFATTTSFYRARRTVPDELIPGTLNVGHTLPTLAEAFIWICLDPGKVEPETLVIMIVAAVLGALTGAPIVSRWPRRWVQIGLGSALLVLCTVLVIRQIQNPSGGQEVGLSGAKLAIGIAGNFTLGALMTIGVGLYAPCLLLVWLLGMNPLTAFPIMMCSCAFLMPPASAVFVRRQRYSRAAALGLTLGGVPAVVIAMLVVQELNLNLVKWLVAVIVLYTAFNLLRAAHRERQTGTGSSSAS
jgi:uncharacterized membrane protein YfcA